MPKRVSSRIQIAIKINGKPCRVSLQHALLLAALFAVMAAAPRLVQAQSSSPTSSQSQTSQKPDQMPPEAGGPGGEVGPMAVPKKTKESSDEPPPPPKPKKQPDIPEYSLRVDVPVVNVDARVITKDGRPLALPPNAAKEHFKIYEDGVAQKIQTVTQSEAPITAVLLVEFDMRSHILVDFTQDKQAIFGALNTLRIPGFSETNLWDAMYDTLDRLERIQGHKELVIVASGVDTMSHMTFDKILKKVKSTPNVTIYTITTGNALRTMMEARYGNNPNYNMANMDYLVADNQMKTFAQLTGGHWYSPRFMGELPDIFKEVAQSIRNQYTITYQSTNPKMDGTYRKLKVELVGPDDKPLVIKDEKNHDVKYQIIAREGYTAKHEVE